MINNVSFSGRLTRDAELVVTQTISILKFSLASNYTVSKEEKTIFLDCSLFGDRGTNLAEHLTKGKHIYVQGSLQQDTWEGTDGSKRSKIYLVVDKLQFLDKKNES